MDPNDADPQPVEDPIREQLLEAAANVFAEKGYAATKIMDVVKASGLSSGAVYGRFPSKRDLLLAAVLHRVRTDDVARRFEGRSVIETLVEGTQVDGPLDAAEAIRLEMFITARHEPDVAAALAASRPVARATVVEPLVRRSIAEGSASPDVDFDSLAYFMQTLYLGRLIQRGAGLSPPDKDAWRRFMERLVEGVVRPAPEGP